MLRFINSQRGVSAFWDIAKVVLDEVAEKLASGFCLRSGGFQLGDGFPIQNYEAVKKIARAVVKVGFI